METKFNLFNKVSTGILIINSDYKIIFWNNILEVWTGLKYENIVGKNISVEFERFQDIKIQSRLESVFNIGVPVILSSQIHKYLIPCNFTDNQLRYQHTIITSLKDDENESKFLAVFSIQDVTDLTKKSITLQKNI